MGLENSASASKIIILETLRLEFGLDLAYENLGQRVTGNAYWRGVRISLRRPQRRVLRTTSRPLEESASHHSGQRVTGDGCGRGARILTSVPWRRVLRTTLRASLLKEARLSSTSYCLTSVCVSTGLWASGAAIWRRLTASEPKIQEMHHAAKPVCRLCSGSVT